MIRLKIQRIFTERHWLAFRNKKVKHIKNCFRKRGTFHDNQGNTVSKSFKPTPTRTKGKKQIVIYNKLFATCLSSYFPKFFLFISDEAEF
jgi:hypothetical protein